MFTYALFSVTRSFLETKWSEIAINVWFISFFVLVDEVTKNKNRLRDFLYDVFRLQGKTGGKTGQTKKNNNKKIRPPKPKKEK